MKIWKNIDEFEESIFNMPRMKAPAYLYSRIQSKLMTKEKPLVTWKWAAFSISAMVILNISGISVYLEAEDRIEVTGIYESMLPTISTFSYDEE